jgi:hypothetical protein
MAKSDLQPMMFVAGSNISVGHGYIDDNGWLWFKSLSPFGKERKVYKIPRDLLAYHYGEYRFYNPHAKDNSRADVWKVFYFELEDMQEFNFKDSTPQHISMEVVMLRNKVSILESEREELLAQLRDDSIRSATKRRAIDEKKFASQLLSFGGGSMSQGGVEQKSGK